MDEKERRLLGFPANAQGFWIMERTRTIQQTGKGGGKKRRKEARKSGGLNEKWKMRRRRGKKAISESWKTNAVEVRVHSRPLFHHTFRALLGTWDVEQVLGHRWGTLSRGTFIKLPTRKCAHAMSRVFHAITLQVYKLGMQCSYIPTDWLATCTMGKF